MRPDFALLFLLDSFWLTALLLLVALFKGEVANKFYEPVHHGDLRWLIDSPTTFPPLA